MCRVFLKPQEPNPEVLRAVSQVMSVSGERRVCTGVDPLGLL